MKTKLLRIPDNMHNKLLYIRAELDYSTMQSLIIECLNRGINYYMQSIEKEKKKQTAEPSASLPQKNSNLKPADFEQEISEEEYRKRCEIARTPSGYDN